MSRRETRETPLAPPGEPAESSRGLSAGEAEIRRRAVERGVTDEELRLALALAAVLGGEQGPRTAGAAPGDS